MRFAIVAVALFAAVLASPVKVGLEDDVERMSDLYPCSGNSAYMLEVKFMWSGATHPNSYPDGGHFSPLVVATHNMAYTMWQPLGFSTMGVQNVAETGDPTELLSEIVQQKFRNIFFMSSEDGPTMGGIVTIRQRIRLRFAHTLVSFISMLAPSPDWFTGEHDIDLCDADSGTWVEMMSGDLAVYDAGTDTGSTFLAPDNANMRKQPIVSILGSDFEGIPVGTWKLTRIPQ